MDAATHAYERSRELAALRRRAYGPDADIQGDPEALRRLNELEELARPADPEDTAGPVAALEETAALSVGEPADAASDSVEVADSESATNAGGRRWWRSGRLWAVAAISLVCGLAIGATALALPASFSTGGPDVTLRVVENADAGAADWAQDAEYWGVMSDSAVRYEDYDNIQVLTGVNSEGRRCLLLSFRDRIFTASCAGADLDPVLDVYGGEWPVFLEESLNPGGVLRFIARPDAVDVWFRPGALNP